MSVLSKLKAKQVKTEVVHGLTLREMTWAESLKLTALLKDSPDKLVELSIALSLTETDGSPSYESEDVSDLVSAIITLKGEVVNDLFEACDRLSLITAKAVSDAKKSSRPKKKS